MHDALQFFKESPKNLIIIHDDSDLALGTYTIETGRGAAGHHGVESIMQHIDSKQSMRVRIGIRDITEPVRRKAEDFVLHPITKEHLEILYRVFAELREKLMINENP